MRGDADDDFGCAYRLGGSDGWEVPCGRPRRPDSSFCQAHHALCHVSIGSAAERRGLDESEALAQVVGGRLGRAAREPPEPLLRRLDWVSRLFSRADRSRYVQEAGMAKRSIVKRLEKLEEPEDVHGEEAPWGPKMHG